VIILVRMIGKLPHIAARKMENYRLE
jgi:hypothetical protein